ncbi:MAG: response regulator [Tenuifilaceae bacterium]|jgi:CheY-like chemotaxis protein|nr:response regulator [Tenuifilaceae bacterium]
MKAKPTILFVDDEPVNLMVYETCFGELCNVLLAQSGAQALSSLEQNSDIQGVFSDIRMPGMDGIEFIGKAKPLYPSITFFVVTGYGMSQDITSAIEQGLVSGCFYKPIDMDEVEAAIMRVAR